MSSSRGNPHPSPARSRVSPAYSAEVACLSDDDLLLLLREGSHDAMSALFDRFHRLILSITSRILRDAGEAEDMMQDVFLEIYRKAALFDPRKGSTKTWILQYAYHRSFNRRQYLSIRGFYQPRAELNQYGLEPHVSSNGWGGLTTDERVRLMLRGMTSLTERQRTAIRLAYFEGLVVKEIAERMGEPVGRVSNYYFRGLRKLRDVLHALMSEEKELPKCTQTVNS